MPQFLKDVLVFFKSEYLTYFWWLMFGYVVCYLIATVLARALSKSEYTILSRCRKGWAISFLAHTIAAAGLCIFWFFHNGMFASFWQFFPFYLALIIVDLSATIGLFASRQQYLSYNQ